MTARLLALVAALLVRLGFPLLPVAEPVPVAPMAPLCAARAHWAPLPSLGLPGHYTPQTGGEP